MPETSYILPVWIDTRIRHYHRTEGGDVVKFTIQLEVESKERWRTVIRYDTAHGYAHIDRLNLQGKRRKERLHLNFSDALTRAERDIKQNWWTYRETFLRGGFP